MIKILTAIRNVKKYREYRVHRGTNFAYSTNGKA